MRSTGLILLISEYKLSLIIDAAFSYLLPYSAIPTIIAHSVWHIGDYLKLTVMLLWWPHERVWKHVLLGVFILLHGA